MASPARMTQAFPETLPDDFGGWDSVASPATSCGDAGLEANADGTENSQLATKRAAQNDPIVSELGRSEDAPRPWRAVILKEEEIPNRVSSETGLETLPSPGSHGQDGVSNNERSLISPGLEDVVEEIPQAPEFGRATRRREPDALLFASIVPETSAGARPNAARSKWITVGITSGCAILLSFFLVTRLFSPGTKSIAKPLIETRLAAADASPLTSKPKPSAATPLPPEERRSATGTEPALDSQPAGEEEQVAPSPVRSQMMSDQLNSPRRISRDLTTQAMETPPPSASFGTAGTEGWGGSVPISGMLPGQRTPIVKAAPETAVRISAGMASGLLIQKSRPTYPAIAKAAHVSGTVELQATVSKVGTIQDLQVVSGPAMLRQAAIEAVRTWRYQPYKVNNQPVEVQTTILVVFTLGA